MTNAMLPRAAGRTRRDFVVIDLEAKDGLTQAPGFTRPFLGVVYDGEHHYVFRDDTPATSLDDYWSPGGCVDKLMRWLLQRRYRNRVIYAHNGGRFDFLHLMPWVQAESRRLHLRWEIIPLSSSLHVLSLSRGRDRWRFVDSIRVLSGASAIALQDAARIFADSSKLDHDLTMDEDDPRWEEYCRQDCTLLYDVLQRYHQIVEDQLGGRVGVTLPSTAMRLYRARYQPRAIQRSKDTHDFVRRAYYGGAVIVFRRRGEHLHYYDINSSYAASMLEPQPCGRARWHHGPPPKWREGCVGFVEARVRVPDTYDPPTLPVRWRGRLTFPAGEFAGVWDWLELETAIMRGTEVLEWGQSVWYRAHPILRDYATDLYHRRVDATDAAMKRVVKDLLNSLYGKFGQHPLRRGYASTGGLCIGDGVYLTETECDREYIIPQIAAHITALARARLWRVFDTIHARRGTIYYCDTDSVITDVTLPTSAELGALKEEYAEHGGELFGEFLSPKCYYLCAPGGWSVVRAKGLERDQRTVDALQRFALGEQLWQHRLEKVGTLARASFGRGPRIVAVPRTWHADTVRSRDWLPDGTSRPLKIGDTHGIDEKRTDDVA